MPRNSFIQMTKLHNVRGRIYYISSPKKQENLYAVYETTERSSGVTLQNVIMQNLKKVVRRGNVLRQGN